MEAAIKVGMADWKTATHPGSLITLGLGSCVGVCLYDAKKKIIGMAHIMLPNSDAIRTGTNRAKFADTGIADLLGALKMLGTEPRSLTAKIAGGAQMFAYSATNDIMRVGVRNAEAVRQILATYRIPLLADDTGGTYGRTIEFHSEDGRLMVKTIGHGVHWL